MRIKILFFLIFFYTLGISQEVPPTTVSPKSDTLVGHQNQNLLPSDSLLHLNPTTNNTLYTKQFEKDFKNKFKSNEFNYSQTKPQESIWERIKRNLGKWINKLLGKINPTQSLNIIDVLVKVVSVLVIGTILYFLIKFLLSKNGNLFWSKKNNPTAIQDSDLQENIHEINFAKEISQFEQEKNFRFAIRYQFLWTLKKLSDRNLIQWNLDKTNQDYEKELLENPLHSAFSDLMKIFEYVWYGEFSINEKQYANYKSKFENFL